jgi:hypothetical protein
MRFLLAGVFACMVNLAPVLAQEGHPLVGSWHGDWGEGEGQRDITLIMDWDGGELSGLVNPGYEHAQLENARLDSSDWTVHFELDWKDSSGETRRCIVDGAIGNLGSDRRTLTGSWNCGTGETAFRLTRDRDY